MREFSFPGFYESATGGAMLDNTSNAGLFLVPHFTFNDSCTIYQEVSLSILRVRQQLPYSVRKLPEG